jgi:hypothetical protein
MAVLLDGSTQYLSSASIPFTTQPFCMAAWFRLRAVGSLVRNIVATCDTTVGSHYHSLQMGTDEIVLLNASDGVGAFATVGAAMVPGAWHFSIARCISTTERRISLLAMGATTLISHGNNTTSKAPNAPNLMSIGVRVNNSGGQGAWDGSIAEAWFASGDVFQSGSDLPNEMVMQLAFGGPFSMPHIAAKIVDYRSLRSSIDSRSDRGSEIYQRGARQTWSATGAPGLTDHPPLPYWFQRPGQVRTELVI